jgi:hypothetical protein
VLPSIIHSDQKGYVKNRYIGFNIRQIQDVIDHSEKFNIEGAILFLDFTNAFDSLEWSFMTECLTRCPEQFFSNLGPTKRLKMTASLLNFASQTCRCLQSPIFVYFCLYNQILTSH